MTKKAQKLHQSRTDFHEADLLFWAEHALGIMVRLQAMSQGPLHPRLTGIAIQQATWGNPNAAFRVRKLMLDQKWIAKTSVGETPEEPAFDRVTTEGANHAARCDKTKEELARMIEEGLKPPLSLKPPKSSRTKRAIGYDSAPSAEDQSPVPAYEEEDNLF